jgi:hypothetical protein
MASERLVRPMSTEHRPVRPSADQLRGLPTLDTWTPDSPMWARLRDRSRAAGVDFRLELKLETRDARFWLCTRGADGPGPGVLPNWIVDNVTVEPTAGAEADLPAYSPAETKPLQALESMNLAREEVDRLHERAEADPTPENLRKLDEVRDELTRLIERLREQGF